MATTISWTEETWNPLVGCSRISPGCKNCYAADAAKSARLQQFEQYRKVKDWDGTIEFVQKQLLKPLSWKSPKKVFVCSMSDIFHARVDNEWLNKIFAVMAMAPQHTFQVLTKRPDRMRDYLTDPKTLQRVGTWVAADLKPHCGLVGLNHAVFDKIQFPLPNVWLGTSVENQKAANSRIAPLLATPAAVRFLSCEPLLDSVSIAEYLDPQLDSIGHPRINWVIVGGESGKDARECHVNWIRSLVRQCRESGTAVFVKQLGSNAVELAYSKYKTSDRKGGNIDEFPSELKVREFPRTDC